MDHIQRCGQLSIEFEIQKEVETRDTNLKIVTREMVFKAIELQLHRD